MIRSVSRRRAGTAIGLAVAIFCHPLHAQTSAEGGEGVEILTAEEGAILLEEIYLTAGDQLKQTPGVSIIAAEDLEKAPPARDLSEMVRRMPGVNLTGNSSTGARGNNRQIDIRGMGPENTLILIDGKPVLSRNSTRMSVGGERDSRGDSSWIAPELVERIEVIRGPAAARYGSGAAGGVVNIITKRPETASYSLNAFVSQPQDGGEGATRRLNFSAAGPVSERLSYRFSAGASYTDPDDFDINGAPVTVTEPGRGGEMVTTTTTAPAGREGVVAHDLRGLASWEVDDANRLDFEASWSRQRNQYAGDTLYGTTADPNVLALAQAGDETNRMTRSTLALSHFGNYEFGSTESWLQWERTVNRRFDEAFTGPNEGEIAFGAEGPEVSVATLDALSAKSELHIPLSFGVDQMLTLGADYRGERMTDSRSISFALPDGTEAGIPNDPSLRDPKSGTDLFGLYAESNLYLFDGFVLTPGLRLDHHSEFGFNASPSLNASWDVTKEITLKAGVARAFKAPNLFQLNPNYVYYSRGRGCWGQVRGCYILGNEDLDPEISINKEIGVSYADDRGWAAGATFFHNDYDNRIGTGHVPFGSTTDEGWSGPELHDLMRWRNGGPATISGIEGNLSVPISESLTLSTNFTKMITSEDENGQPLSLVPDHTINMALEWQATDRLGVTLSATHFGRIVPPTLETYTGLPLEGAALEERDAYALVNLALNFDVNENAQIVAGVNNLFDKQLLRTGAGANSYNEPGRSFYLGVTTTW